MESGAAYIPLIIQRTWKATAFQTLNLHSKADTKNVKDLVEYCRMLNKIKHKIHFVCRYTTNKEEYFKETDLYKLNFIYCIITDKYLTKEVILNYIISNLNLIQNAIHICWVWLSCTNFSIQSFF